MGQTQTHLEAPVWDLLTSKQRVVYAALTANGDPYAALAARHIYVINSDSNWQNWSKTEYSSPLFVLHPTSVGQLKRIIKVAVENEIHIRCQGAAHSGSALVVTSNNGLIIDMTKLTDNNLEFARNGERIVSVPAAATLVQFNEFLRSHELCLPNNIVGADNFSMGGVFAVGAHGSNNRTGAVYDNLKSVTFLRYKTQPNGTIAVDEVTVRHDDQNRNLFRSLQCHLGLLGIVIKFEVEVRQAKAVNSIDYVVPITNSFHFQMATQPTVGSLVAQYDHVELFWFPYTKDMWIKIIDYNRTRQDELRYPIQLARPLAIERSMFQMAQQLYKSVLNVNVPQLMSTALLHTKTETAIPKKGRNVIDAIHYERTYDPFTVVFTGWACNISFAKNPTAAQRHALSQFVCRLFVEMDRALEQQRSGQPPVRDCSAHPIDLPIHIRFIRPGNALIAPNCRDNVNDSNFADNNLTVWIELIAAADNSSDNRSRNPSFHKFTDYILLKLMNLRTALLATREPWMNDISIGPFRSHWAKRFPQNDKVVATYKKQCDNQQLYPERNLFVEQMQSCDPKGIYRNEFARKWLDLLQ